MGAFTCDRSRRVAIFSRILPFTQTRRFRYSHARVDWNAESPISGGFRDVVSTQVMRMTNGRNILPIRFWLPALSLGTLLLAGCSHGHHHEEDAPQSVVLMDEQGYRHEGYYDRSHNWHGGYYDERHEYHSDAHDWHGADRARAHETREPVRDERGGEHGEHADHPQGDREQR